VTDVVVAVDVGGTKIASGLVSAAGEEVWRSATATPGTDRGRDHWLPQVADVVRRVRVEAAGLGHVVRAVSLGFPEYVRHDRLRSNEVIAWVRQPADVLAVGLDVPVYVESDVRGAAFAEARLAPPGEHDLFYVSWGTGISSTLVVDGRCRPGRRGEALALGEFDVPATVDPTWTGNLEQFASGDGIARRYEVAHPGRAYDGRAVAERAAAGDLDATAIVQSAANAMARAVRSCIAILDPDAVVFGGGIGAGDGLLVRAMRRELDRLLSRPDPPAVRPARSGDRAGVIGVGLTGWQRLVDEQTTTCDAGQYRPL
jgi:glucokinase